MLLAFTGLAAMLWAVPAKRGVTKTVMGADGQEMTVTLRGDETFHYYVNSNGTPVCEQADGTWAEDTRDVKALWRQANQKRNTHRLQLAERMQRAMKAPRRVGASTGASGSKKGLLILVNFKDVEMVNGDDSKAIFDQMLNAIDNPYGKNYGSVREYFRDQSYGQLDIEFDVVGPVTVSQNMSYYGANDSEGNDKAPEKMVNEACQLVNSEVDFSDYDWDGDGEVENIYVTYAGYGEASGAAANTIWPHQYYLSAASLSLKLDGVKIDTYACGSELYGTSGSTIDGIGTMCHEYSHCLGLPDFYDIDYSGGHGMFDWDIMDQGSYNGDGYCPAGYTAYERWFSGWLEPVELNSSRNVNGMKAIEDEPEAYIIYNDGNRNEYYMLANHQQKGWNKAEAGKGMLILRVDYSKSDWENNGPNDDPNHQRMTIIPADNKFNYRTSDGEKRYYANAGDLWPGSTNNTALTDTSTPKATLYNANTDGKYLMHKPIEDITEENGLISFRFMGGVALDVPTLDEATDITATGFQVAWSAVEDAASYNLKLTEKGKTDESGDAGEAALDALKLWEYFEKFRADKDGSSDLSSTLDNYTDFSGWTGSMVYKGTGGAKLGSSKNAGYMTSPQMICESGKITIYVEASSYGSDKSTLNITVLDENGNELLDKPWSLDLTQYGAGTFVLSGAPSTYKVKFSTTASKKRLYLSKVFLFDGEFTTDQIQNLEEPTSAPVTAPDVTTLIKDITDTQYTFTELSPETQYTVQVQAVDSKGNTSAWSEVVSLTTLAEEPEYALGDVNKDGVVSIGDVTKLVNWILTSAEYAKEADINGDGEIGIADVTALVNIILGKVSPTGR